MTTESDRSRTSFSDLGLDAELVAVLESRNYTAPTPVQAEAIPPLIEGRDVLAQAATGTGKTAAFALPILHNLGNDRQAPSALILTPTRELAMQVSDAIGDYGKKLGARVVAVYGGAPITNQINALRKGVDIVVATPGRATDHLKRRTLDLRNLSTVVLDEADEMLDMGFADELDEILGATPDDKQTALFSATMPPRIETIARTHLRDAVRIQIARPKAEAGVAPLVTQTAYIVGRPHKAAAIARIIAVEAPQSAIAFCQTREQVDQLATTLNGRGCTAEALHGGMDQVQRDRVMNRLRKGTTNLLIATDVAARGLDIDHMTHVFNYDVPGSVETYTHRIGRVGRAGRSGVAITLVEPREQRMLKTIERVTKAKIEIAKIPSVEKLRTQRLETLQASMRNALVADDATDYKQIVDELGEDFDVRRVAATALKMLADATTSAIDENEIPEFVPSSDKPRREYSKGPRERSSFGDKRGERNKRGAEAGMTRLFVGVGRNAQVRPQDLVGAIANESGISGRDIGAIDIAPGFSLVDVPDNVANKVIASMKRATIKGKKVNVRRDRGR